MNFIDAHNHLQDAKCAGMETPPRFAVVNGTRVSDWYRVTELAQKHPWIIPSYGLHPWFLAEHPANALALLEAKLDESGAIGEIGLDRRKEGFDEQKTLFHAQMEIAVHRNLPATIHCLKAWGALMEILRAMPLPQCGFLLHSYSGSKELIAPLVKLGAYFSFSINIRETLRHIPPERLLLETDAHPAGIADVYKTTADFLGIPLETLALQVEKNFLQLFKNLTPSAQKIEPKFCNGAYE